MTHRTPEPHPEPGIERLILADCDRVEADHRPTPDGVCVMCLYVWRRPVPWPCEAARLAARLRELCGGAPGSVPAPGPTKEPPNRRDTTPLPRRIRLGE